MTFEPFPDRSGRFGRGGEDVVLDDIPELERLRRIGGSDDSFERGGGDSVGDEFSSAKRLEVAEVGEYLERVASIESTRE